jgi:autotransporter-associated beta strand protein
MSEGEQMKIWQHSLRLVTGLVVLTALAGLLPPAVQAQQTVYWRSETGSGLWWNGTSPKPWWYSSWNNEQDRPDRDWRTANDIVFDNNNQTTHDVNGNDWYYVRTLTLAGGASSARTFNRNGSAGIDMRGTGTRKIENNSTASHVFNIPVSLVDGTTQLNPVSGNLTFSGPIYLKSNWIEVWGDNQKTLYLNGVLEADGGTGGLAVKQNSIVVLTNNNTFTGGIWVEKGTVRLNTHTNAMGAGAISVGTNATLDLQHGTVSLRPATLNLYGTGTNAGHGALRKTTSGATTWRGNINLGADSRIVVTAGGLNLYGGVSAGSYTLYITNTVTVTMQSGSTLSGSKTTGDGALRKSGGGAFVLRPGTNLTGNIFVDQGEIRQSSGTMSSSGTLTMAGGTKYSSDGGTTRTMTKALVIKGGVGLAQNSTGGLEITNTVSLDNGTRIITNKNQVLISGKISSGGLGKAGDGTMILTGDNDYAGGTVISGGTLQIGNNGTAGVVTGAITNNAALVWYRSDSVTNTGVISGTGTLTKQGAGTLTLTGSSTMSGGTTVSAGTLLVSGALGSSAMTVNSGATLAGAGTVGPISSLAGTISPGNSTGTAGTLNVNGAASLIGTYTCDITGTGSTACDKIAATGAVSASGALTINLPTSAPSGFSACDSYSWTIMMMSTPMSISTIFWNPEESISACFMA